MNPILYLIFHFLKLLTKTVFGIFFSKTTIINKELLKIENATILVSNHPNTLLDPLNTAARVDTVVYFLANAGLFEVPVLGFLLSKLFCIPVERQNDVNGRGVRNHKNFERCDNFLTNGGCLYIAPEGTSVMEYHLRKLKTGTARIALRAEAKNNFQLGLKILPVGLTYSAPADFRSEVVVNVGQPITIAEYQALFEEDSFKAARKLTEDLQNRLGNLIYNTHNDSEEQFIRKLETIINNEKPVTAEERFFRTKKYISLTRDLKNEDPESYSRLNRELKHYFTTLKLLKLNDKAVLSPQKHRNSLKSMTLFILGFPFFIYGYLNNFLAFFTPALIAKKVNLYIGYTSTVKTLMGLITVPLFYSLQIGLFQYFFQNPVLSVLYGFSLLPLGWFAWEYLTAAKQLFKNYRASLLWKSKDQRKRMLKVFNKRKALLDSITSISSVVKL